MKSLLYVVHPLTFLYDLVPVACQYFAGTVLLVVFELSVVDAVLRLSVTPAMASLHSVYPVTLVEIAVSVPVDTVTLPLITLEIALIVAHLVDQASWAMHQTVLPVSFVYRRTSLYQGVPETISLPVLIPLSFIQISIRQFCYRDKLPLSEIQKGHR